MVSPTKRVDPGLHPCADCRVGTCALGEYYMILNELWPHGVEFLCVGCLELRLGRELSSADFTQCPVNWQPHWDHSPRLLERITRP